MTQQQLWQGAPCWYQRTENADQLLFSRIVVFEVLARMLYPKGAECNLQLLRRRSRAIAPISTDLARIAQSEIEDVSRLQPSFPVPSSAHPYGPPQLYRVLPLWSFSQHCTGHLSDLLEGLERGCVTPLRSRRRNGLAKYHLRGCTFDPVCCFARSCWMPRRRRRTTGSPRTTARWRR